MMPLLPAPATTPRAPWSRGIIPAQPGPSFPPKNGARPSLSSQGPARLGLLHSLNIPKCIFCPAAGVKNRNHQYYCPASKYRKITSSLAEKRGSRDLLEHRHRGELYFGELGKSEQKPEICDVDALQR